MNVLYTSSCHRFLLLPTGWCPPEFAPLNMQQDRIPPLPPDLLSPTRREAHDFLTSSIKSHFGPDPNAIFQTKAPDGSFIGPLATMVRYPALAKPYFELLGAIAKLADLSPEVRETVIITVGAVYECRYELYAHKQLAAAKTSLRQEQIEALSVGAKPNLLSQECELAHELSYALAATKGPLVQKLFDMSKNILGLDATMAIVNYVGIYAHTCILLNAVNASVPE